MFDMSDDTIFIRHIERMSFLGSLAILCYLNLLWLAAFYIFVGFSIIFSDDDLDEMHENDIDTWHLHQADLSTAAEREGFVLTDDDILDLLQNAHEDPILPLSYRMVDGYANIFLNKQKNLHKVEKYEYDLGGMNMINVEAVKNFAKHKVTIKKEFEKEFFKSKFMKRYDLIRFKTLGLVINEYIATSFFTQGIYPINDYDLSLFKAHEIPVTIQYPSYTCLVPSTKNIYILNKDEDINFLDKNLNHGKDLNENILQNNQFWVKKKLNTSVKLKYV